MKLLLQILFVALLLPVSSSFALERELKIEPANSATPKKPLMKINVPSYALQNKDFNFPSGLRVVMQADHSQPIVAVTSYVDRGSKDDPVTKEGIAHFVEHLWFKSKHGDLPKVWNILSDMGTSLNASTGDDYTNYMTVAPSRELPALLRLESLRLTDAVANVSKDEIDTEREVIRNELRMRKENGFMGALPYLYEKLYDPDHPYARGGIGSHESLNNIGLEDIQAFVNKNYRPELTTIAVVGDFDPEQATNLIFENISPHLIHPRMTGEHIQRFISSEVAEGEEPDPDNPAHWVLWAMDPDTNEPLELREPTIRIPQDEEPPESAPAFDTSVGHYQAPVDGPTVVIGWSVPGAYRGAYDQTMGAASYVASAMIANHFWNVYEVWHDEPDLPGDWGPIDGGCFFWASRYDSKVICMLRVKKEEDAERMGVKVLDQMAMLWNPDLREVYLEQMFSRAKMENLAGILNSIDVVSSLQGRATGLAQHAHYTGSVQVASDSMNQVMKLEAMEVAVFASKYLRRERAAMVVLTPIPEEDRILDSSDSGYRDPRAGDANSALDPSLITDELVKDAMVIPPIDQIVDHTLSNGLKISVLQHGETPLVDVMLLFGGGDNTDKEGMDWFSDVFQRSITEEYTVTDYGRGPKMVYDPLQIAGGWIHDEYTSINDTHTVDGLRTASGNLNGNLWLLREYVDQRRPYLGSVGLWLKRRKGNLANNWSDQAWWEEALRWRHVNPDHVTTDIATFERYDHMKEWGPGEVKSYLDRKYHPHNAHMLIIGDIRASGGAEAVIQMAEDSFGGWKGAANPGEPPPVTLPPPNKPRDTALFLYDDPKNTQTDVSYQCQVTPTEPVDRASLKILGDILDDQVWDILREQSGVTYGASAAGVSYLGGSAYLYMNSLVQNNSSVLAIKTFMDAVAKVETGELDEDDVKIKKLLRAKKYGLDQQSLEQMRLRLKEAMAFGEDWSYFEDYRDSLAAVDKESVTKVLGECSKNAYISVRGPVKVTEPMLKEAGLEYTIYDWEEEGNQLLQQYDMKRYKKKMKAKAKKEKLEEKEKAKAGTGDAGTDDAKTDDE